ncbi:MAG: hypothetical protein ACTSQE_08185 [Candidatus Heimdallarchaeaceae archaeon]
MKLFNFEFYYLNIVIMTWIIHTLFILLCYVIGILSPVLYMISIIVVGIFSFCILIIDTIVDNREYTKLLEKLKEECE